MFMSLMGWARKEDSFDLIGIEFQILFSPFFASTPNQEAAPPGFPLFAQR
jgi:hypothetical protein